MSFVLRGLVAFALVTMSSCASTTNLPTPVPHLQPVQTSEDEFYAQAPAGMRECAQPFLEHQHAHGMDRPHISHPPVSRWPLDGAVSWSPEIVARSVRCVDVHGDAPISVPMRVVEDDELTSSPVVLPDVDPTVTLLAPHASFDVLRMQLRAGRWYALIMDNATDVGQSLGPACDPVSIEGVFAGDICAPNARFESVQRVIGPAGGGPSEEGRYRSYYDAQFEEGGTVSVLVRRRSLRDANGVRHQLDYTITLRETES